MINDIELIGAIHLTENMEVTYREIKQSKKGTIRVEAMVPPAHVPGTLLGLEWWGWKEKQFNEFN